MKHILTVTASMFIAMAALAQGSFDDVISAIVNNNPELQGQSRTINAQRLSDSDDNALANPSVEFARVWGRDHIGNKLQLDISQEFAWPGLYAARSRANQMAVSVAEAEYAAAAFDIANQVRALLTELVYVRRQKSAVNELQENFGCLNEAIDKGVRGGELTVIDQRKMQIESYEIDNDMGRVLAREQQIISELNAMTSTPLDLSGITAYPIQPLLTMQEYIDQLVADPYIMAQGLQAEQESQNARVASQTRMPSFSVGYQHQAEMGDRFNGFTVGMSLPFFEGRHARQAALDRKDAAELSREMLIAKRTAEIKGTYGELEVYRQRIDAYNKAFGDNAYLALLLKAYNGGQLSVIEYLSELHYYHQTMLAYIESEYNYNLTLTTLNCYSH